MSEENEIAIDLKQKNNSVITSTNLKGKQVLVVDDNIMNRMVADVILKEYDVHVTEANDGEEAVNYLKNNPCDLVLMDLQMPVLNGYQASKIIRLKLKLDMPIIALTASDSEEEKRKCYEVGMNDYLSKPFNKEQFLKTICTWIGGSIT
jgi:CheY-like chemotaxis protein